MKAEEHKSFVEKCVGSKRIYDGKVVNLRVDEIELPDGTRSFREVVEHRGAVAIVAVDGGSVLLVKQYRYAVGKLMYEIPAGTLEAGEDPRTCAQRELQEETGFLARELLHLGGFYSSPGIIGERMEIFLARNLEQAPLSKDHDERIEVHKIPFETAVAMIESGEICDAKSIIGLTWAQQALAK